MDCRKALLWLALLTTGAGCQTVPLGTDPPGANPLAKAVELDPENRHYGNTLGFCLARAGRIQESLTLFSKASGQAVAYYNVSRVLRDNQQEELSRRYLQQALALNPNFPEAQQMLA